MKGLEGQTRFGLEGQTHYEVLEVSPGARPEEIERAYRLATSTWASGSLALYSLFEDAEAAAIRERVLDAYRVLSDEPARRAYDRATFDSLPVPEPAAAPPGHVGEPETVDDYDDMEISLDSALEGKVEGSAESGADVDYDGPRLRRSRLNRGLEIAEIAKVTKVTVTYLRAIEEEAFDSLPPAVYVRGFVNAYARAIGLEGRRVAQSYMLRYEQARAEKGRGRILGRR